MLHVYFLWGSHRSYRKIPGQSTMRPLPIPQSLSWMASQWDISSLHVCGLFSKLVTQRLTVPLFTVDSGTQNVIGPLNEVRAALQSVGYNVTEQKNGLVTVALVSVKASYILRVLYCSPCFVPRAHTTALVSRHVSVSASHQATKCTTSTLERTS